MLGEGQLSPFSSIADLWAVFFVVHKPSFFIAWCGLVYNSPTKAWYHQYMCTNNPKQVATHLFLVSDDALALNVLYCA